MISCFFSYSWEDADDNLLERLKEKIEKKSEHSINVIYDKNQLQVGDSILDLESKITNADIIVIFFTPSYKKKVLENNMNYGVCREYKQIIKRKNDGFNYIIPIILSKNGEVPVTQEFENIIYEDFSKLKGLYSYLGVSPHKRIFSPECSKMLSKIAQTVIRKGHASYWMREHDFTSFDKEYKRLFVDTASTLDDNDFPRKCFVKMTAYDMVLKEQADIVIGRKGSGKTTFLNMIYQYDPAYFHSYYKEPIPINADALNINYAYSGLISDTLKNFNIISMAKVLDVFWEIFFVLHCMATIKKELSTYKIVESDSRIKNFKKIVNKFNKKLGVTKNDTNLQDDIFSLAIELVSNYFNDWAYRVANEETLISSVVNNFTPNKILEMAFGQKDFVDFCNNVKNCQKKIFVSIDGYDTQSEDFRRQTRILKDKNESEYNLRKDFEIYFYRELIYSVYNIRKKRTSAYLHNLFSKVHFCVIMPQDRFEEIKLVDRDIEKRTRCNLCWDAHDLLEMLVKRLEYCYEKSTCDHLDLHARLEKILGDVFPTIPKQLTIEINGNDYNMSLFNYILRLSFWRPRDILKNFAWILKINEDAVQKNQDTQEIIKSCLTKSARDIIENEFFSEYQETYSNLGQIVHRFTGENIILETNYFADKLSKIHLETSIGRVESIVEKISILYKLGVIGLYFDKKNATFKLNSYGHHMCFVFNEGLQPLTDFLDRDWANDSHTRIIFNPIFSKYLMLNVNTNELIGNFTSKYIDSNHLLKDGIRRY